MPFAGSKMWTSSPASHRPHNRLDRQNTEVFVFLGIFKVAYDYLDYSLINIFNSVRRFFGLGLNMIQLKRLYTIGLAEFNMFGRMVCKQNRRPKYYYSVGGPLKQNLARIISKSDRLLSHLKQLFEKFGNGEK